MAIRLSSGAIAGRLDPRGRIVGCRSDVELAEILGDIRVIGGPDGGGTLKAGIAGDGDKRRALIASIRGGEHVELEVTARTFRQKDGKPNRRFLRFKSDILAAVAGTFVNMPVLLDHNQWETAARIGTIIASEIYEQGDGWSGFRQTLRIVKPEAAISVLDGTLDRFSIGWAATGPVLCSVHRTDVRQWSARCCWPGDQVATETGTATVEYEYTAAEGIEVSAVNVPAVKGTKIEDVRSALAAELSLEPTVHEFAAPLQGDPVMSFTRLAALLGLSALAAANDEDHAVRAVEGLKRDKLAAEQERDVARTELAKVKEEAKAAKLASDKTQIDIILEKAYRDGKLLYSRSEETGGALASPREARLRRIASEDGIEALKAEISEMPEIAPVNRRVLKDDGEPRRTRGKGSSRGALASVAEQLGHDPDELEDYADDIDDEDEEG